MLAMVQSWLYSVLSFIVAVIATIVVALATQLRGVSGFVGASLITLMSFTMLLTAVIRSWTQAEVSMGAVSRLTSFTQTIRNEDQEDDKEKPPVSWPEHGGIEIRNVSAAYR
jgi:ATP-binding cassette subfamily C (CFTR/MRP) protein 1